MSNKILGTNELIAKTGSLTKNKTNSADASDVFAKILDNAVSETKKTEETDKVTQASQVYGTNYINPLNRIDFSNEASSYVEKSLEEILSGLEAFSGLMADDEVSPDDIIPVAGALKEDADNILRYSEKNNVPEGLKSIARESSALAYAALEKLNSFS